MDVWAPRARAVDLVAGGDVVPMRPDRDGWFRSDRILEAGVDYAFSVDTSEPLPDPRSHWQPSGVFGPSRIVDHDAFPWTDRGWRGIPCAGSLIYELHIGTFATAGTFDGAVQHLDHLVELGVDLVEVMPVNAYDGDRGWGYDGVLLYAVHEPYGGPEGFKRFVDAAHARGIGVLLDVVYNHLGPTGNHLGRFGPYLTDRHHTHWGDAVNLDGPGSAPVRRFLLDNAQHWLANYHLDGLRLDAVHTLVDESEPHLLTELAEEVEALATQLSRPLSLVAEFPQTEPRAVMAREAGGHGLTAAWRDEVHHALHAALTGERDGYYGGFGSLRDVEDALDGPKDELPRHRFVAFSQNHDQVGNRARGDRLAHIAGVDRAKLAAALVLCGPFTPMLFMGEEWAASSPFPYFCGPRDDVLDDAVRRGRHEEFAAFDWDVSEIPDPLAESTFASASLQWDELADDDHADMIRWYRDLVRLRRARSELSDPRPASVAVDFDEVAHVVLMRRGSIAVAANLSEHVVRFPATGALLLASQAGVVRAADHLDVPPHAVAITG
jgi:maltooligosyltrehalose trehalohydrolase